MSPENPYIPPRAGEAAELAGGDLSAPPPSPALLIGSLACALTGTVLCYLIYRASLDEYGVGIAGLYVISVFLVVPIASVGLQLGLKARRWWNVISIFSCVVCVSLMLVEATPFCLWFVDMFIYRLF